MAPCPCCNPLGTGSTRVRGGWRDSLYAYLMNRMMAAYRRATADIKPMLFSQLMGTLAQPPMSKTPAAASSSSSPGVMGAVAGTPAAAAAGSDAGSGRTVNAGSSGAGAAAAATTAAAVHGSKRLRILELGVGAGANFQDLTASATAAGLPVDRLQVVGLDPNPAMHPYALKSAAAAGLPPSCLQLVLGSAEALPFEDDSFDAAVMTLVLRCAVLRSVTDPR